MRGEVVYLPVGRIAPNPMQPRRRFDEDALRELAESVAEHGVLQPLTVRSRTGGYELVAGERRLRAARLAGLEQVPCLVIDANMEDSSVLALVENLQRSDLDFVDEARGIAQLTGLFGMSAEEAARRLGKSRSAISNKLRVLRLPGDVLDALRDAGLGERHARTLLRLEGDPALLRKACEYICAERLSADAAERYADRLLQAGAPPVKRENARFILKDLRVFMNSISKGVGILKEGGIDARVEKRETESEVIVTVCIPKRDAGGVPHG